MLNEKDTPGSEEERVKLVYFDKLKKKYVPKIFEKNIFLRGIPNELQL